MIRSKWVFVAVAVGLLPVAAKAFIFDGAHHYGNPHFFFLPPMVDAPKLPGVFDPTLHPVVEIVDLADGSLVAVFTTDGEGDEAVRLDDEDSAYIVHWHTADFELNTALYYNVYRIWISVDGE